jgi:hypothetical protein
MLVKGQSANTRMIKANYKQIYNSNESKPYSHKANSQKSINTAIHYGPKKLLTKSSLWICWQTVCVNFCAARAILLSVCSCFNGLV